MLAVLLTLATALLDPADLITMPPEEVAAWCDVDSSACAIDCGTLAGCACNQHITSEWSCRCCVGGWCVESEHDVCPWTPARRPGGISDAPR